MKITLIIIGIAVLWSIWGLFSSRVEQAEYVVTKKAKGYELRKYQEHLIAQTKVTGDYQGALNSGFRIIASYIFGNNKSRAKVAMTAPVTEQKSETIAMTAPVTSTMNEGERVITFTMPKSYTLETLPVPNDSRVEIVKVPEKTFAALRFSWWRSASRVEAKKAELLALLKKDGVNVVDTPLYAGYNAPWTPPWMMRNEILVEVRSN